MLLRLYFDFVDNMINIVDDIFYIAANIVRARITTNWETVIYI